MNKKGWISTIFLIYFTIIVTWVGLMEYQTQKQIQTFIHMKKGNEMFFDAVPKIDQVYCDYLNHRLENDSDENEDVDYKFTQEGNVYFIDYEDIQLEIEFDSTRKEIMDYRIVLR